jgi:hypothetical protein
MPDIGQIKYLNKDHINCLDFVALLPHMVITKLIRIEQSNSSHFYLNLTSDSRIFVIGPSHHVYTERMNITGANILETPLGNLVVDTEARQNLIASGLFDVMNSSVDSEEHSLEMQVCTYCDNVNSHLVPIYCTYDEREAFLYGDSHHVRFVCPLSSFPHNSKRKTKFSNCFSICSSFIALLLRSRESIYHLQVPSCFHSDQPLVIPSPTQ